MNILGDTKAPEGISDPHRAAEERAYLAEAEEVEILLTPYLDGRARPAGAFRDIDRAAWYLALLKIRLDQARELLADPEQIQGPGPLFRAVLLYGVLDDLLNFEDELERLAARSRHRVGLERAGWKSATSFDCPSPRTLRQRSQRIEKREKPFSRLIISTPARPCAPPASRDFDARRLTHSRRREPRLLAPSNASRHRTGSP